MKKILLTVALIAFISNINAQIKKVNKNVSYKPKTAKTINIPSKKVPLLQATNSDLFKGTKSGINQKSIKRLTTNNKTFNLPEKTATSGKLNVTLSSDRMVSPKAEIILWRGYLYPREGRVGINPNHNNALSILLNAEKNHNYHVELILTVKTSSNCSNPKLTIGLGSSKQSFNLREGENKLNFVVNTLSNNGRIRINVGYKENVTCDNNSNYKPILELKKAIIKEL
jgi:hypothetical protein